MACVTACPSGVQYGRLIEAARPAGRAGTTRAPAPSAALREVVFALFPHPKRLRAVLPLLWVARVLRLGSRRERYGRRAAGFHGFSALARLAPPAPVRGPCPLARAHARGRRAPRARRAPAGMRAAGLLLQRQPRDSRGVLAAEGYEVVAPGDPPVLRRPPLPTRERRRKPARFAAPRDRGARGLRPGRGWNAAGCGSAMEGYGAVAGGRPALARPAPASLSDHVRDVSEILAGAPVAAPPAPGADAGRLPRRVPPRARAGRARANRARCCARFPGLEIVEPREWELCCGSAGLYNVLQPEAADALGRRKAENLLDTGAAGDRRGQSRLCAADRDAPGGDGPAACPSITRWSCCGRRSAARTREPGGSRSPDSRRARRARRRLQTVQSATVRNPMRS